jgi:hypothetical protein
MLREHFIDHRLHSPPIYAIRNISNLKVYVYPIHALIDNKQGIFYSRRVCSSDFLLNL